MSARFVIGVENTSHKHIWHSKLTLMVHDAFEPATGQAEIVISPRRDTASHIQLIEKVIEKFPCEKWLLIEDNLSTHHSRDVKTALLAWPEV